MIESEKEKKKGLDVKVWVEFTGTIVAILLAGTTLLSLSKNVPYWWFESSLILFVILVFSVPVAVLWTPISERTLKFEKNRKEDSIVRRHFKEFEDLVDRLRRILFPNSELWTMIKEHYKLQHTRPTVNSEMLPANLIDKVLMDQNQLYMRFFELAKRCEGFSGNKRDFSLLITEFNGLIQDAQSQVRFLSLYANELQLPTSDPPILKKYEEFREQYNIFINDYMNYCRKLNLEIGQTTFIDNFDTIQKW